MTPEGKVLAGIVRLLKTRQRTEPLFYTKLRGSPMQRSGLPDLIVVFRGRSFWLEVKAAGGEATPLQWSTLQKIRMAGGVALVVRSVDEAMEALEYEGKSSAQLALPAPEENSNG